MATLNPGAKIKINEAEEVEPIRDGEEPDGVVIGRGDEWSSVRVLMNGGGIMTISTNYEVFGVRTAASGNPRAAPTIQEDSAPRPLGALSAEEYRDMVLRANQSIPAAPVRAPQETALRRPVKTTDVARGPEHGAGDKLDVSRRRRVLRRRDDG